MTYITKAENVLLVDTLGKFTSENVEGALSEVKSDIETQIGQHANEVKIHNNFAIATGTNDYVVTLNPAPTQYVAGMIVSFLAPNTNTNVCTLNCNGLGAKPIYKNAIEELTPSLIREGQVVSVVYDGTNFQITSGSGGGGGGISIPFYTRVTTTTETDTISTGMTVIDTGADVVFVYQNSTYLANGQDYTVVGTNIVKSEGTWAIGTVIDVVVFVSMTETSKFYLTKVPTSFTATENSTTFIPIGSDQFDQTMDVLEVYYQNLKLFKDVDYTIALDNSSITLTSFSINSGENIRFEIFKKVKEGGDSNWSTTGDITLNGSQLISTVATGEAPFTVQSTTAVTNLNADLLDGQHGNYYATASHNHDGVYAASTSVGAPSNLITQDKINTVNAINEVKTIAGFDTRPMTNLIINGDMSTVDNWSCGLGTLSAANNILTGVSAETYSMFMYGEASGTATIGHVMYVKAKVRATTYDVGSISLRYSSTFSEISQNVGTISYPAINTWYELSGVVTVNEFASGINKVEIFGMNVGFSSFSSVTIEVQYVLMVDLTDSFEDGLEPTYNNYTSWLDTSYSNRWFANTINDYSPTDLTVQKTGSTGAAMMPVGTTEERPQNPIAGQMRYNTDLATAEMYNGTTWAPVAGGQMLGQATTKAISYNAQTIAENITIPSNVNASAVGPITVETGYTLTVETGARLVIL